MVAAARITGFGATLSADPTGGTSFAVLGDIMKAGLKESGAKAAFGDGSLLTDVWDFPVKGGVDGGEVTFSILYGTSATTSNTLAAALKPTVANQCPNWKITYPDTTTETFLAWVAGLGREIKRDEQIMCEVTLRHYGNPGFTSD